LESATLGFVQTWIAGLSEGAQANHQEMPAEVFKTTSHPTVIETGCIRDADEGTESTLTIASTLNSRGMFYKFEICKEHIRICQSLCRDYNEYINPSCYLFIGYWLYG
jgi:hypothetical protein